MLLRRSEPLKAGLPPPTPAPRDDAYLPQCQKAGR